MNQLSLNPFLWRLRFLLLFALVALALVFPKAGLRAADVPPIDRHALVTRHHVVLTNAAVYTPLSVGNGEFAFTADVTGLQTFDASYGHTPLTTMSQWGFHTMPNPQGYALEKFPLTTNYTSGHPAGYLYDENGKTPGEWHGAANYLYANPGRIHLGRIAMVLKSADGHETGMDDLKDIHQELDLWTGELRSQFSFEGDLVEVSTCCHPDREQVAVQIHSTLIAKGRLSVLLAFPYGTSGFNGSGGDFNKPNAHQTVMTLRGDRRADFARTLDDDRYYAAMEWAKGNHFAADGQHRYRLTGNTNSQTIEFITAFSQSALPAKLLDAASTKKAAAKMWKNFWSTGGAIDLSQSKDSRWFELERRIVLSQYLTRIQCCGSLPPQETGLTGNSWFGKFHLEMHWWHAAHFPLWGHGDLLERSLPFYQSILPKAKIMAARQGYEGARWPKCVGPAGDLAPSYLEAYLIWQQPHPISYAELCYREHPDKATLKKYQEIVFETAKFMASFVVWETNRNQYRLGPPFADAAEVYFPDHDHQWNPTFEISYWRAGLETAQKWRERLGMLREKKWDDVIAHLPPLTTRDGLYVSGETATDTFTRPGMNKSHPCMLAPLGMLNDHTVDRETMRRTLHQMMAHWDWNDTWGWDFPLMAMTAARLGEGETAIQALLLDKPKNSYLINGHNPQGGPILPLYLPGNGGVLYATAMMAAGWDGAPAGKHAPGFPADGNWVVKWEGLKQAP